MVVHFAEVNAPAPNPGEYWVYILESSDGALYVGQTNNVPERLRKHGYRIGSKFTRDHIRPTLVYVERRATLQEAVSREAQLKRWSRAKKEALIRGDAQSLHRLSRSRD
ncbi:GIY-YIG nuclease family protein [Opitutus terrae]|uniref:Excinuclease ABC C subunit domain protein n=1 Tax=Opitutus terrae (strain DSM 11246 / JCM 15787 / PB90-1) TaxID=452637 RepID=B1ZPS5_OPITP|nr:GIY-YIG nuclease family protein [Opitutus terrae]ACB75528.1 Excinuclease ABC C subunit domain protein [Opitutus terrae PB90-1]